MRFDRRQWWIIAAAALVFALVFGVRQSQALFISPLNSATGLGIASISLAFAVAQLMWGITQPFAGAMADRYGSGRVIALGGILVTLGTVLTPHAHSTWMLILLIGVVAAGGAGMAGLGVLMSAVGRAVPPQQRGLASGIVNAGGSFGQFAVVPVAQLLTGILGWVGALSAVGAIGRWRMKSVLSLLYAARGLAVIAFLAAPKTTASFIGFAVVIGFTYLATVPPTVGLVAKLHGMRFLATLFGIVMLSHQIGGFLGAWLGGKLFEATGGYQWMWYADVMLAFAAALIHLPISEAPRFRSAAAAA